MLLVMVVNNVVNSSISSWFWSYGRTFLFNFGGISIFNCFYHEIHDPWSTCAVDGLALLPCYCNSLRILKWSRAHLTRRTLKMTLLMPVSESSWTDLSAEMCWALWKIMLLTQSDGISTFPLNPCFNPNFTVFGISFWNIKYMRLLLWTPNPTTPFVFLTGGVYLFSVNWFTHTFFTKPKIIFRWFYIKLLNVNCATAAKPDVSVLDQMALVI